MKLRNKKTGNVIEAKHILIFEYEDMHFEEELATIDDLGSIKDLNENWEDYTTKEPLIKDEKIRKAVRMWAETVDRRDLLVIKIGGRLEISDGTPHLIYISFHADEETLNSLDDRTYYTIAELCGEEEE